jgi:hypothetical protein
LTLLSVFIDNTALTAADARFTRRLDAGGTAVVEELMRLGFATALGVVIIALSLAMSRLYGRRSEARRSLPASDLAIRYGLPAGQSSVLYISSERCKQCVELQEPALNRLSANGRVHVRKLHALSESDLASRFNILTVPSTVVIGPDHRVRSVNMGFTDEKTLEQQLA